jgi:WD40-like Beta Propeller Repeat
MRRFALGALTLAVLALVQAQAEADFTAATLLSGTAQLQFDEANAPVLSQNGHYAVFQGSVAGVPGVYRRDLDSGALELVAGGDAAAPSVSADGRFIAFTSTAELAASEPAGDNGCPEVYVRDMGSEVSPTTPTGGAFTLVSALDGTSTGIEYAACPGHGSSGFAVAGAQAAPGVAISADGRHVVFTVLSASNLTTGSGGALTVPASQVAVRDLDTQQTTLVSATPAGQATPGGGAFPSSESESRLGSTSEAAQWGDQITGSTAAISADASTVAWLGTNVPEQVPGATEIAAVGLHNFGQSPLSYEVEPLWRRVADGPAAITQRLLAGAGLDFFINFGQEGPTLDGSFVGVQGSLFIAPALSADGSSVALIANAPPPAAESSFRVSSLSMPSTDAYLVHAADGQAPQVTALTAIPNYAASLAAVGDIRDVAISPDGSRVAFDTIRTQLTLPALAQISPPSNYTDVFETYEANVALGTLQRVSSTFDGSSPNGSAGLLAFSGDGQTLAFASRATNLFYGDGISASEVYVAQEAPVAAQVAPQQLGPAPVLATTSPDWVLSATAVAQPDGSVLIDTRVPGTGRLTLAATAQLPAKPKRTVARRAKARQAPARGKGRSAKGRQSKASGSARLPRRTVAKTTLVAGAPAELHLRLHLAHDYQSLATVSGGLYTLLGVSFTAPGHPALVRYIPVTFRVTAHGKSAKSPAKTRRSGSPKASKRTAAGVRR